MNAADDDDGDDDENGTKSALPDCLIALARDVHLVSYRPSDDVCVQIVKKFPIRCIFDALKNEYSCEEDEEQKEDEESNNLALLCELVVKLSKCARVLDVLLLSENDDERGGCTREDVLDELTRGMILEREENVLLRRARANALMEIMSYCCRPRVGTNETNDTTEDIFDRLLPDVVKGMLETEDEKVHAALESAALAAAKEEGRRGERRRTRVKDMVLGMTMTSSVAKSRALNAIAALSSERAEEGEGNGKEGDEIERRRKEIEAFEDTVLECAQSKDALLLAVSLESLGELCERDGKVALGVFRNVGLRGMLFKEEKDDGEENGEQEEEQSVRLASLTCAARVCGSAAVALIGSRSGDIGRDSEHSDNDVASFETCATIFVEKATAMCTNGWSNDESSAAADALGTFCAIALSPSSPVTCFTIVQALMLDSLETLTNRSFHKSCVASIHALANASFFPAEIMQKLKMEKSETLQARFKKLKVFDGPTATSLPSAENGTIAFETQLRTSCYSASSYRGSPAESIAKALANTPGVRGNENDVQKRIALYRLAQSLGTRAWFARDCLMSSSTEALISSKNLPFEPTSEAMRWRMSALKAIALGAMEARALDMIDESQYIQIKSTSEMNPFLGVGGISKAAAIPDVATLPR